MDAKCKEKKKEIKVEKRRGKKKGKRPGKSAPGSMENPPMRDTVKWCNCKLYHAKNGKIRRTLCTHSGGVKNDKKIRFLEI